MRLCSQTSRTSSLPCVDVTKDVEKAESELEDEFARARGDDPMPPDHPMETE